MEGARVGAGERGAVWRARAFWERIVQEGVGVYGLGCGQSAAGADVWGLGCGCLGGVGFGLLGARLGFREGCCVWGWGVRGGGLAVWGLGIGGSGVWEGGFWGLGPGPFHNRSPFQRQRNCRNGLRPPTHPRRAVARAPVAVWPGQTVRQPFGRVKGMGSA